MTNTMSSMGSESHISNGLQVKMEEAVASLPSEEQTLEDLGIERVARRSEVEKLREELRLVKQEQRAMLAAILQNPLAQIERHAQQLIEAAPAQEITELKEEKARLQCELQAVRAECLDVKAALEAAQGTAQRMQEELTTTRQELDRNIDKLNVAKDQRTAAILKLEELKKTGKAQDQPIESIMAELMAPRSQPTASETPWPVVVVLVLAVLGVLWLMVTACPPEQICTARPRA
ncbi:hypothetical protein DAEQUDRAFT_568666 [Daedalea quercina L-15889]|uniref:Uncharacterized protein n=1 Tax=Daedalea quercina L-15889 TaxID=1314783 RepID=A0A165LVU4_9APHY|nr:hypothetical protein DAEQUDRAFT_568666 [Daedalea quercina L-15889]